jgi:polyphosphate glucokinase
VRSGAKRRARRAGKRVLVIDIGGSHVKVLASGERERRRFESGPSLTPRGMVEGVGRIASDWRYDVVSIGYPGVVAHDRPVADPHNLGPGWVGFDFRRAFGRPVRIVNDATMQALGSYRGGRMLFLGLGTGLGSTLIVDGAVAPLELAHLPYRRGRSYEDYVGSRGLERLGLRKWRRHVGIVAAALKAALEAEDLVLGGGNARKLAKLPAGARRGNNAHAFLGGFRLWEESLRPERGRR